MPYIPNSDEDRKQMKEALGIKSISELFSNIPDEHLIQEDWMDQPGSSEQAVMKKFNDIALKNDVCKTSFLGGGAYDHYIPSVIKHIISRSEFYTAYTPYQPEVSQGTLQAIYEYQTMICELTGMDVSNASLYDGATANAEAILLSVAHTKRRNVIIPDNYSPNYREVIETYANGGKYDIITVKTEEGVIKLSDLKELLNQDTACVIMQYPNYCGVVRDLSDITEAVHEAGALMVASVNPMTLALLTPPGEFGVDIVTGEGQVFGNDVNWGGPYLGIFAVNKPLIRKMPGRIVGKTVDVEGKQGFVLTLQTREQNIRREKATSNICTNQGLMALKAVVYLTLMGKEGLREVADQCLQKAHYLSNEICEIEGFSLKYSSPFFHEFVIECPKPADEIINLMLDKDIYAGISLKKLGEPNSLLIAVTEQRTKEELDNFVDSLKTI